MLPDHFLPWKVVFPRPAFDYVTDPSEGGGTKLMCPVTKALRAELSESLDKIKEHFQKSFESYPEIPAVAKVVLREKAHAKSHRPTRVFDEDTCPIIGGDAPGELYVSVNEQGLGEVQARIRTGDTDKLKANISTIQELLPFREEDALDGESPEALAKHAKKKMAPIRLRMFRHQSDAVNAAIDAAAKEIAHDHGVEDIKSLDYGEGVQVFAISGASANAIRAMARFKGTQNVSLFPTYTIFKAAAHVVGSIDDKRFPPPATNAEYGVVGLIDSGTDLANVQLQKYVVAREDIVPRSQQNNEHGTFVGGLIANPRALNNGNRLFPSVQAKIIDIVAIDGTGAIDEFDLITAIDYAIRKYPHVKVWNLSLGQDRPCKNGRFSPLALKLDSIQKKRGVLFVIAAGNYEQLPLAGWPRPDCGEDDRIGSPADSVRGLTVGSIAHIENQATCVRIDEPSPFTRRGPAPHFYIKPEISHYAGNCDANADCLQSGVVSLRGKNQLAENIGTSFSTAIAANLAANVFRELEPESDVSPTLVKAMLVHSAFVRSGKPRAEEVKYRGFGSPGDLYDILNCSKSSASIVFHAELTDRRWFDKMDFPMPICLHVPKTGLRAEVFMTLAYDPPTDARFGIEYCRSNVTASLGTMEINKDGDEVYRPQLTTAPKEIVQGYEDALVKEGFKWSPLKLYYRSFESGPINKRWRLHLEILNRSGVKCKEPQKVVLLVTIRDPTGLAFVYNAMVKEMERLSWGAQNLRIASRVRPKN
jgi:serine protease AprX